MYTPVHMYTNDTVASLQDAKFLEKKLMHVAM